MSAQSADDGGDPACWLEHVCERCGAFVDADAPHTCRDPVSRSGVDVPDPAAG